MIETIDKGDWPFHRTSRDQRAVGFDYRRHRWAAREHFWTRDILLAFEIACWRTLALAFALVALVTHGCGSTTGDGRLTFINAFVVSE